MADPDLLRIDTALLALRHLWAGPSTRPVADTGGVELSTVWVVDALTRSEADGVAARSVREVAAALGVAHSTASRLIDRAEAGGMVRRERSGADARLVTCALTPAGRDLAAEALAFRTSALEHLTAGWSGQDRDTFARLIERFAEAVVTLAPPPPTRPEGTS